ncbi:MAG: hypothetical protein ACJ796_21810 [Gemmatimonadaceae bacterium]
MYRPKITTALSLTVALALSRSALAQTSKTVRLHVNPRWKECSFQLDSSLTQSAWHQFTQEAGIVTYFRPLDDAAPMGRGQFELSLLQWKTGIHDSDPAWNDTFVHPDSTHWLFEGDGLKFPGLTARAGITDRTDAGVYFTKSPGANYGFYGGQLQHNFFHNAVDGWAASARMSFVSMYGPKDIAFSVYGVDVLASKRFALFSDWASVSPYVGGSTYMSRAHEKSSVVDLTDENVLGVEGMIGAAVHISAANIAAEYGVARVRSFSLKVGVSRHI